MSDPDARSTFGDGLVPDNYERHLAPFVFGPWAELLVVAAGVGPGDRVLDVACGTGVAARRAALIAGAGGSVTAIDLNEPMLARGAAEPAADGAAPIAFRRGAADALPFEDDSFDAVLCQQGLQFFGDRQAAAIAEMRRVVRPGGSVAAAVWASGYRLEPFGTYAEAMVATDVPEPFPQAYDAEVFNMLPEQVSALFEAAGFAGVETSVAELTVSWPDVAAAVGGLSGSVYGPAVARLDSEHRARVHRELERQFAAAPGEPITRVTAAVIALATTAEPALR